MRITKKDLEHMTDELNKKEGRPIASHTKHEDGSFTQNEGHVILDHAACYGGYALRVLGEKGEGFYYPSWERLTGREMYYFLMGKLHEPSR